MPNSTNASGDSSPFLNRLRAACRRKGYTYRTEKTYLRWIVRYVKYHGTRHPREFGKEEVRDYLSYLATDRPVAASTQKQALNALLFLHRDVLGAEWDEVSDFDRAQEPERKWQYVFPSVRRSEDPRSGKIKRHHRSPSAVQKAVKRAVERTDITKSASCHTLRHSFTPFCPVNLPAVGLRPTCWNRARTLLT